MGRTREIALARMYTTPKDPQIEPKAAMDLVKGQSADPPEAAANNDVDDDVDVGALLAAARPEGMERIGFDTAVVLVFVRFGRNAADCLVLLLDGVLIVFATKPSESTAETPSQKKTVTIVERRRRR